MVQRSYNAFAVRVQSGEGIKRQVVPACGTREGELCIEMRIKIYPDGVMSNLLLKLAKVRCRAVGACSKVASCVCRNHRLWGAILKIARDDAAASVVIATGAMAVPLVFLRLLSTARCI